MILAGTPHEYTPYGRVLLPLHPKERSDLSHNKSNLSTSIWTCSENDTTRDLFNALKAINIHEGIPKECWSLRECEHGEEELYLSDKIVVWSKGNGTSVSHLVKTFTMENTICQSVWCQFKDDSLRCSSGKIEAICIVDCAKLEVFVTDGNHYPMALPFQINKMFPSEHGLVLERLPLSNETSETPLPLIFSLTHPLKEISPVIFKSQNTSRLPQVSFLSSECKLELVAVLKEQSLMVMFNRSEGTHSIFILRESNDDELKLASSWCEESGDKQVNSVNVGSPTIDSPFMPSSKHSSKLSSMHSSQFSSSVSSPFRNMKLSSHPLSLSSPSSLLNPSSRSITSSSVSISVMSPLRSSRLAASPASPQLRLFASPLTSAQTPTDPQMIKFVNFSRNSSLSKCSSASRDYDLFSDEMESPLVPELTMDYIWSETFRSSNEKASKVFITNDMMGQAYLALLLKQQQLLKLIRLDRSNDGHKLIFGTVNVIHAKDAEDISSLNMLLTIDSNNTLVIYSGLYKTSIVQVPSSLFSPSTQSFILSPSTPSVSTLASTSVQVNTSSVQSPLPKRSSILASSRPTSAVGVNPSFLPDSKFLSPVMYESDIDSSIDNLSFVSALPYQQISKIISLQDAVNDKITVSTAESTCYRFKLPPLVTSSSVSICLAALKSVLPREASMHLLIKWYSFRNASGLGEYTNIEELDMFRTCLFALIGYDNENTSNNYNYNNSFLNSPSQSPEVFKKIKLDEEEGTEDDWDWLSSNKNHFDHKKFKQPVSLKYTDTNLFPHLPSILYSLHLVYEDMKLVTLTSESTSLIVEMLYLFAVDLKLVTYQYHYWRDFPHKFKDISVQSRISENDIQKLIIPNYLKPDAPSIYYTLQRLVQAQPDSLIEPFPYIVNVTKNIRNLVLLYANLNFDQLVLNNYLTAISILKVDDISFDRFINFNSKSEKTILMMDQLSITRQDLQLFVPALTLPLLDAIFETRHDPPSHWNSRSYSLIGRDDLTAINMPCKQKQKLGLLMSSNRNSEPDEDGVNCLANDVSKLLFPNDQRILEACNMLVSSKSMLISIQQKAGVSDHDFIEEQERHLYAICIRTMALPVGRGMITMRSYSPVVAETFPVPKLNLTGRVPPRNNTIDLSHIEIPPNMTTWPLFHNGVAAGLRISANSSNAIDSTWIVYNRPKSNVAISTDAQNEHAGFLLALGLNGHLACLSTMSIHDYLCKGNELTRVAVLLGLAAAKRGTMDVSAMKVLSIHVEALLPPTSTELDVPPIVQVAAVLGVGLIYMGSGHHHIAEVLLGEIGRPPGPEMEHYIDRESYALSAGLAFGLVTLGKGNDMIGLVSSAEGMSMADQLCHYMLGGHKRPLTALQREKYKTPSYQIREGDCINADVTSPGATLALGMMFFNTNNEAVAKWVAAPETQYLLEMVRPDFLLLRALCRGLVMWSNIDASVEWIESHIPFIVNDRAFQRNTDSFDRVDYETMSQAYCNIVAGACFALGLKFAGSANERAFTTVKFFTDKFIAWSNKPSMAEQAGRSTIESCLNVLVISLAMIMAGTGNIEVMRICRLLRSRINQAYVLYGSHMAIHMALGLLFLAGCKFTLSSSPEAVAVLICAFFPKFPIHSNDNRYHLQAFRHLYVLASEPRLIIPRDIFTKQPVYVHLHCRLKTLNSNQVLRMKAPCFLPELNLLENVIIDDERYWRISFEKHKNWETLKQILDADGGGLYVKQKIGCLSYIEDPKGFKSLHSLITMKDAVRGWSYKSPPSTEFSQDFILNNFCKFLLSHRSEHEAEALNQHQLCSFLFECASNEKIELLQLLIVLSQIANQCDTHIEDHDANSLALLQIKFAISIADKFKSLTHDFIHYWRALIEKRLKGHLSDPMLISYLKGTVSLTDITTSLSSAIIFYDIPPYSSLSSIEGKVSLVELMAITRKCSMPMTVVTAMQLHKLLNQQ